MRGLSVLVASVALVAGTVSLPMVSREQADVAWALDPVVITVDSTSDRADSAVDGVCQTSVANECSLRAALTEANAVTSAPVIIRFAIAGSGVHRIALLSRLPLIDNGTAGITIDGYSQPGSQVNIAPLADNGVRLIEIVGTGPNGIDGLIFLGSNNVARGLVLHGFKRAVRMTGTKAQFNIVAGNVIGLLPNGALDPTFDRIVGSPCVDINSGASRNKIGMPGNENRNVISGCYEKGVTFYNQFTWKNSIHNNIIGLDPTGTQRRGNGSMGIDVNWSANGTIIGGTGFQEHNVISGNLNSGVEISHGTGTINNRVVGNYIGTDLTGNAANAQTVNHDVGVRLEGEPDCGTQPCSPDVSKATVTDNVIVNSGWGGILVDKGTHSSLIANNRIGVTLDGTIVGNGTFGVRLAAGATRITVGPDNIVAGPHAGIQINPLGSDPASDFPSPTQDNTITRNSIVTTGGLGIDIRPYATVNQNAAGDVNAQRAIDVPVLAISESAVTVSTCANCTVELFATSAAVGAFGPGETWIATLAADSAGQATFDQPAAGWPGNVTATTTMSAGSTSEFAATIRPGAAAVPGPPTSVVAVSGPGSAQVSFAPPADNGSPITAYTVTAIDQTASGRGGQTATGASSPLTVNGLTNGDVYTFTVQASNSVGTGPASAPSNAVTPSNGSSVAVSSLSPKVLGQAAAWRTVKVNGSGFVAGAVLSFGGTGVTVKSLQVTSSTLLTAMLSVAADAPTGGRDVTVVNPDGGSGGCAQCFTVAPAPTVTAVTPSSVPRGATNVVVDVTGANFGSGVKVTVSGTGVTVGGVTRVDAGRLQVTLSVSPTADLGGRAITVTNPDAGNVTIANALTVA